MSEHDAIPEWAPLPIVVHRTEDIPRDTVAFTAIEAHKYGATIHLAREILNDSIIPLDRIIFRGLDRAMRPWIYPRVTPFPVFVVFPTWDRLAKACRKVRSWVAH